MSSAILNLSKYDPFWIGEYENEKCNILSAISHEIIDIEHIGSTSVKGLGAKPIIDIMVGIANLEDADNLIKPLGSIQYEFVPKPELIDRRFFRKGLWGQGTCHLHICEFNSTEWVEKILFRDYLRNHPESAIEYYKLKKSLAKKYQFDRQTYTKKKEPFIREIIKKAKV